MARRERVTKVIDGDTFQTAARKRPVRLAGVDTPERGRPGHAEAKRALERLAGGREVSIDTKARDRYGRAVANVQAGGKSVNRSMRKHSR